MSGGRLMDGGPHHPRLPEILMPCRPNHRLAAPIAAVFVILGCSSDATRPVDRPMVGSVAAFGKGTTTTLAVTSATPAFGDQGTTVDVHIHGSGFAAGAAATLLLHGGADAHVKTNSTTFVSSTELVANVTIAPDAPLAFWDVQVALGDKNGVGSEAFEITSA